MKLTILEDKFKNEDDPKMKIMQQDNDLKNKDTPKNEDNTKNGDDLKYEEDPKMKTTTKVKKPPR